MAGKIAYITGNEMKFNEAKAVLGNMIEWVKIDLPEIQSIDPKEVIKEKVNEAVKHRTSFIVEDVSFKLHCLSGLPGTLVKWFLNALGTKGIYELAKKYDDFASEVICSVCYVRGKDELFFFDAVVSGEVVNPKENSIYQWDSVFEPDNLKKPFSALSLEEKNLVSPRGIALKKLKDFIESGQ